jgi:hypothetical protein
VKSVADSFRLILVIRVTRHVTLMQISNISSSRFEMFSICGLLATNVTWMVAPVYLKTSA